MFAVEVSKVIPAGIEVIDKERGEFPPVTVIVSTFGEPNGVEKAVVKALVKVSAELLAKTTVEDSP